jgi:hydroxypyruvate isomerase
MCRLNRFNWPHVTPIDWCAARLTEMGIGVGPWNWPDHDLTKLEVVGANCTIMNGYLRGRLADDAGADMLLTPAGEAAQVCKRLGRQIFFKSSAVGTVSPSRLSRQLARFATDPGNEG